MNELANRLRGEFSDKEYAHSYADEILNAHIAAQIKVIRNDQLGWSQQRLAEESGMKQERISVLENINYSSWSVNTLRRLAKAFDLRLRITFESFSTLINDMNELRKETLMRKTREQEINEYSGAVESDDKSAALPAGEATQTTSGESAADFVGRTTHSVRGSIPAMRTSQREFVARIEP